MLGDEQLQHTEPAPKRQKLSHVTNGEFQASAQAGFFAELKHPLRNSDMVCPGKAAFEKQCGHVLGSRATLKWRESTGQLLLNRHEACGYHVPSEKWLEKNELQREQVPTFVPAGKRT